jgi:hypothetical protein
MIGEDVLVENSTLIAHQDGKMVFFKSFASDTYVYDRTLDDNIQLIHAGRMSADYNRIVSRLAAARRDRSSLNELPCLFPEMIYSYSDKLEFLKGLFNHGAQE